MHHNIDLINLECFIFLYSSIKDSVFTTNLKIRCYCNLTEMLISKVRAGVKVSHLLIGPLIFFS